MSFGRERAENGRFASALYVFIALALVSFSALFFASHSVMIDAKNLGLSMFSGVRLGIHTVSSTVGQTFLAIQELSTLRREYAELLARVTRYEQLERTAAEIRQENTRLRELLGFSQEMRYQHIPAQIIGRDPGNLFSAFVINKGTRAGVAVNMPVIAFHNGVQGLVGRVVNAGAFESFVLPIYDSSGFVSARFAESRHEGIAEGQGASEFPLVMRFIPRRARDEINIGDMVISSGMGGTFPAGINIGRVSRVNYKSHELSMEVELYTTIDFSRLEYVFVIKPAGEIDG